MATFNGFVLTNEGRKLLAKALVGETLTFTKLELGDGIFNGDVKTLTALQNKKDEIAINQIQDLKNGQVLIKAIISNKDITVGYYIREIGIFGYGDDGIEVLYAYNKAIEPDFIPAFNSSNVVEIEYQNYILIDQAQNITALIDPSITYITRDEASQTYVTKTQMATENELGLVTLKQLDELGTIPRGELPKPVGAVYTYGEMLIIPDGQYNINTQTVFSYLGLGSSFMNTGVLFKKTYTVNGIKRVNLNYINSAMDTGITGMSMFFIDVSSENAKNLHTSTTNSGLWQIEQSWGKFNLSEPGYFKMGNGLTFQWFFAQTLASNGDAGTLISYPIAFDNTVLTLQGTDGGSGAHTIGANIVDRFQCRVWGRFPSTGALINSTLRILAIGY